MEKPDKYHFNQEVKVSNTSYKIYWCHVPPDMVHGGRCNITSEVSLPKLHYLSLIKENTDKPKLKDIPQSN